MIDSNYLMPLLVSIVAGIILDILRRTFKHLSLKKIWWRVLTGLVGLLLLAAVGVQLFCIWAAINPDVQIDDVLLIAIYAVLAQLVLGVILYFAYTGQKRQYYGAFSVRKPTSKESIQVCQLKPSENHRDKRLELSWETFGYGLDALEEQIRVHYNTFKPDVCIGMNHSGLLVASYLAARVGSGLITPPVCYVGLTRVASGLEKIASGLEIKPKQLPTEVSKAKSILVVDSEIKSGNSLRCVEHYLRHEIGCGENANIKFAVLSACMVEDKIDSMTQLRLNCSSHKAGTPCLDSRECRECKGVFTQSDDYLPDFLAFVTPGRVWFPGRIH